MLDSGAMLVYAKEVMVEVSCLSLVVKSWYGSVVRSPSVSTRFPVISLIVIVASSCLACDEPGQPVDR